MFILLYILISHAYALELQSGDVLLLSFNCYECRVIESETDSSFSHSGVVIISSDKGLRIAQSLGRVALYSLEDFKKNITPHTKISVYRPVDFLDLDKDELLNLDYAMENLFVQKFQNLPFDSNYLWNNFDSNGNELLYCSEFIAKFLDSFLSQKTIPEKLSYKKNWSYWLQYFRGVIPEGEVGNSPASFSRDSRFKFVGYL